MMYQDKKEHQQQLNDILQNLQFVQQDINTRLIQDQTKIDNADKNMEEALKDADAANEELKRKKRAMGANFKTLVFMIIVLVMIVTWLIFNSL